jgi:hypothetical protein
MHYHERAIEDEREIKQRNFWQRVVKYRANRLNRILNLSNDLPKIYSSNQIVKDDVCDNLKIRATRLENLINGIWAQTQIT